ncbi:unnamed protein product [Paramecium primaurelia]|uniref:WD40-repeat-containing domain n=1 Tax=Paramecium primaurelia TaxID=5886 RepID=A0A8S1NPP3_PARPR|nr:unnamed protein product [Paramecium primaurelia]
MLKYLYLLDNCWLYKRQDQKLHQTNQETKIVYQKVILQSQMIEKEMNLNCNQKHQQRIEKVSLDPKLNQSDKLLCYQCLLNPKLDDKQINFNATVQVIQDKQQFKKEQLENILNTNLGQIEQIQRDICIFKSKLIKQCDKIVQFTNEWISNIKQLGYQNVKYSIFNEIDNLIRNDKTIFENQQKLFQQINQLNQQYVDNVINQIQNLEFKELLIKNFENLKLNLVNINQELDKQILLLQEQKKTEESYLIQIDNIDKQLNLLPSSGIVKLVPIQTLNLSQQLRRPATFNKDRSLFISSDFLNYITIWHFENGKQDHSTTFEVGKAPRSIICSRQFNHIFTGMNGGGIYLWIQINDKEWRRSQLYQKHEHWINDMILNQAEDQLFTGGEDPYINVWSVDYLNNELTFLYNLDSKTITIFSFSLNDSENLLISCSVCEYIIWEKQQSNEWKYLCNQTTKPYFQAKFLKNNVFCVLPINQQISCLFIYEIKKGVLKQIETKTIEFINDNDWEEKMNFPILYNKLKNILVVRSKRFIYFIRQSQNDCFEIVDKIICQKDVSNGILSDDGKFLIFFDMPTLSQFTYELLYE